MAVSQGVKPRSPSIFDGSGLLTGRENRGVLQCLAYGESTGRQQSQATQATQAMCLLVL